MPKFWIWKRKMGLTKETGESTSCRDQEDPTESPSALPLPGCLAGWASSVPCYCSLCPAQAPGLDTKIFLFKRITNYCLIH